MPGFNSPALEQLLWLESQSREHLHFTWKIQESDPDEPISSIREEDFGSETIQLRSLLNYFQEVQNGQKELTWDEFSSLVGPFFETWSIPIESKYLGPIDALSKSVLAHLGRKDSPQYSFIKTLVLLPTEEGREIETIEYFRDIIRRCNGLIRVDLSSAQMPLQFYTEMIRILTQHHHVRATLRELAVDLDFDTDDDTDVLNPIKFLEEFSKTLNGFQRRPISLKLGRLISNGSYGKILVQGGRIGQLASKLPKEITYLNFNFLIQDVGDAIQHFIPLAATGAWLETVGFGTTSRSTVSTNTVSCLRHLIGYKLLTRDKSGIEFRLHAPFGQLDEQLLVGISKIVEHQHLNIEPEAFCHTAQAAFRDSFGGILIGMSKKLSNGQATTFPTYKEITQVLSKISPRYKIVLYSFDGHNWEIPGPCDDQDFLSELSRREAVEFRLSDQADSSSGLYQRAKDGCSRRLRGSFEEYLEAVLPCLHAAKHLTFAFDKIYMHRSRHSFHEVAPVLNSSLPQLCQNHNLRMLTLNFGPHAEHPGAKTQEWISGTLPLEELEDWVEPHIQHCGLLKNLEELSYLEINYLEIITPGQYDWLLRVLPTLLSKSLQKLYIGHIRFCVTSAGEAAQQPVANGPGNNVGSAPVLLQLGRDSSGLGTVSSYLEWQGEFVARIRQTLFTNIRAQGVSGLKYSEMKLREVTFWGADEPAKEAVAGKYLPPFCRQRKSDIRKAYRHVYRGAVASIVDEL